MSQAKFDKAVAIVNALPKDGPVKPNQDDQLFFYARFKQATIGDVNTSRPGMLDFVGKAKWDAWDKIKGKSKEEAMKEYVDKLITLLKDAGDDASLAQAKEIEEA